MKYDLDSDLTAFKRTDALVRAVLAQGRPEYRSLRLITSDKAKLQPENEGYINEHWDVLGVCFGHAEHDSVFDIWINPSFQDPSSALYQDTLIHELVHGYTGNYEHNYRFKRFFGRCVFQYENLGFPLIADQTLYHSLDRYTRMGLAENPEQYNTRIRSELVSIAKVAEQEQHRVYQTYLRLLMEEGINAYGMDYEPTFA